MRISHASKFAISKVLVNIRFAMRQWSPSAPIAILGSMAKKSRQRKPPAKAPPPWKTTYMREYRKRAGFTLEDMALAIGKSVEYLSQLENGQKRYNQTILEAYAAKLGTTPGALLSRPPPADANDPWLTWEQMTPDERARALAVYEAAVGAVRPLN